MLKIIANNIIFSTFGKKVKRFIKILFSVISITFLSVTYGQSGYSHEIGIVSGAPSFSTDYGERFEFQSAGGGNIGFGIGLVHYMNFTNFAYMWDDRTSWFRLHFKLRNELSYMKANLDHFGVYAERNSPGGDKLRAMHGTTTVINLGSALEYHMKDIVDYATRFYDIKWDPYLSLGLMANYYDPTLKSDLGDWTTTPSVLYAKWAVPGTVDVSSGITGSLNTSIGTRYNIGENSDLVFEARWQFFFSNWVDGLNARVVENKSNDWVYFFHVGYIYYLE